MIRLQSPHFRNLVNPHPGPSSYSNPFLMGLGETPAETMTRLEREMAVAQARGDIENRAAFSNEELAQLQKQEDKMLRKMQSDMKDAMIRTAASQLAFDAAINAIPVAGVALSVVMGQITRASGEHYKRKAERDVRKIQLEMENYKARRIKMVEDTLATVYDEEYPQAERAAIALITEKVSAVPAEALAGYYDVQGLDGFFSGITKAFKKIGDAITGFVDDISGKSSYEAAIKQAKKQQNASNEQIRTLTERQMKEARSSHGRTVMRTSIVNMLVQSPQFKRLAELMLQTRRERIKAEKRASLGKKLAIGAGVAALAYGASKVL